MSNLTSQPPHILLITCAGQGHINPTLQLAKRLARAGASVTFATSSSNTHLPPLNLSSNLTNLLSLATFSNGYENEVNPSEDPRIIAERAMRVGSTSLQGLITSLANQGRPIALLIYTILLPWAADVARELHVPSAFLCIQSATTFAIYTSYFNEYNGNDSKSPPSSIKLPELPLFESSDLPTFLLPSSPFYSVVPIFEEHIRALERDPNPTVLVNSFDALEEPVIRAFDDHHVKVITIGPLIPSAYSDMSDPSDKSYGCDLFESNSKDHLSWLDAKGNKSVVYVSFGSMLVMKKRMAEEIFHGLKQTGRPFLWVVRPTRHDKGVGQEDEAAINDLIKEFGPSDQGLIVPWCSQSEVLCHASIGCYVTHCGWNSTLESLVAGVPLVGVPQISDQTTNAKMVEELWHTGVKAKANDEGIVKREEVTRCVEVVMGDGEVGMEIRRYCMKWMELALEAVMDGGSSNSNFVSYLGSLQEMKK